MGVYTVRSLYPGLLEAFVPMLCCVMSVVIGVIFGLQETSMDEISLEQEVPCWGYDLHQRGDARHHGMLVHF